MVAFVASTVLTAAALNTAFNALTIRTVTITSDTLVLADNGGAVSYSNASATTSTIPPNSSVAFATGTKIVLMNLGAGVVTVTAGAGVTVNGSDLTLSQNEGGTCIKTATNTWSFLPFTSGAAAAVVSSSTGSPTITTDGTATVYKFTGDGTLVVNTAGFVKALIVAGGGRGGSPVDNDINAGGGGGGGVIAFVSSTVSANLFLPAGTITIKVGAGGAAGRPPTLSQGGESYLTPGNATAVGGGAGADFQGEYPSVGGSGGGGNPHTVGQNLGATGITNQGFAGGNGIVNGYGINSYGGGGGGGGSALGANGTTSVGGAGGAGYSSDIIASGTFISYGGGGGGSRGAGSGGAGGAGGGGAGASSNSTIGTAGGANTGGGGGASGYSYDFSGGLGGSGVVIVRVE